VNANRNQILVVGLAVLLLGLGFVVTRAPEPEPEPTPAPTPAEPATPIPLTAEEIVELSLQLHGEWKVQLSDEERLEQTQALDDLQRLGDALELQRVRGLVRAANDMGMTVTDEMIVLHNPREEIVLGWTLEQEKPWVFGIETVDANGLRMTWDVTFGGSDRVTFSARHGSTVTIYERRLP
jgi:hypothetical protein